jgi:hypothetical protein
MALDEKPESTSDPEISCKLSCDTPQVKSNCSIAVLQAGTLSCVSQPEVKREPGLAGDFRIAFPDLAQLVANYRRKVGITRRWA